MSAIKNQPSCVSDIDGSLDVLVELEEIGGIILIYSAPSLAKLPDVQGRVGGGAILVDIDHAVPDASAFITQL
jgi:hypothetical protein